VKQANRPFDATKPHLPATPMAIRRANGRAKTTESRSFRVSRGTQALAPHLRLDRASPLRGGNLDAHVLEAPGAAIEKDGFDAFDPTSDPGGGDRAHHGGRRRRERLSTRPPRCASSARLRPFLRRVRVLRGLSGLLLRSRTI